MHLHIFHKSLEQGIFPTIWKKSFITPIHKQGNRATVSNYRPISILSAISKLFEKLVLIQISSHIRTVISPKQHGFLEGRSTITNLYIYSNIIRALENGASVHTIYTDFSKTFDRVDHNILLDKLYRYGFTGTTHDWFRSYLADRHLQVRINGYLSNAFNSTSGVPQGSHLGPILFNLFANDIGENIQSEYLLYADDLKIFRTVSNNLDAATLQEDIDSLSDWCHRNKLYLNAKKCFAVSYSRSNTIIHKNYYLDGNRISEQTEVKDLGITIDSRLTFISHVDNITKHALKILGLINRTCRDFSNPHTLVRLFSSLVSPIIEYGSIIWSPSTAQLINKIEKIQTIFVKNLTYLLTKKSGRFISPRRSQETISTNQL